MAPTDPLSTHRGGNETYRLWPPPSGVVTRPTRGELLAGVEALRQARAELRRLGLDGVLSALAEVRRNWLDGESPWCAATAARLAESTGFHPKMITHALPFHFEALEPAAIRQLLTEELGDPWRPWLEPEEGPAILLHVLAGNLPGLAAWPVFLTLAVGAAAIVKPGAGDPLFPHLLVESLHQVSPVLAAAVWVLPWRGGDAGVEEVVFGAADAVVAQGRDSTMAALAAWVPDKLVAYGERVSFAWVGREITEDVQAMREAAHRVAYDVAVWDQRGCRSPHVCWVECSSGKMLGEFAHCLAEEFAAWAEKLPPRRMSLAEQVAVRRFRDEARWSGNRLLCSEEDLSWAIAVEVHPSLNGTCGNRCLRLQPVGSVEELCRLVTMRREVLEAAGLAVAPERFAVVAAALGEAGVPSVVEAGTMQKPTLRWKPGGRPRVAEWFEKRRPR